MVRALCDLEEFTSRTLPIAKENWVEVEKSFISRSCNLIAVIKSTILAFSLTSMSKRPPKRRAVSTDEYVNKPVRAKTTPKLTDNFWPTVSCFCKSVLQTRHGPRL